MKPRRRQKHHAITYRNPCYTSRFMLDDISWFPEHVCVCAQVLQRPTVEQKQHLVVHSKRVAGAVTELIQTAEAMKGRDER